MSVRAQILIPFSVLLAGALVVVPPMVTADAPAYSPAASTAKESFAERLRRIAEELEKRLLREDPNPASADGGGGGGGGSTGDGSGSAAGGEGSESDAEPYGYDAETPSPRANTPGGPSKHLRTPPDIRPGQNEDAFLENLREAAEKETDSKIREGLWDEYRRYKKHKKSN